jgi:hypothetical protein
VCVSYITRQSVCLIVLDRVCVCVFVSVSFHPKKNPINLFGHWQASTARWWPSTFGRWWDKKKRSKMKIEIIFYKFWTPKSMLHIRIIIFQKEIKLNVLFIKCYWVHRKKMRFKCVMKLPVHVRIKFNSVVSRYHLMCSTKKWVRASVSQFILSGTICTERRRRKNIWSHNSIEQQWPLNSRAKPTPLDFYFYFLKPKFCSFVIPIPLTSLV